MDISDISIEIESVDEYEEIQEARITYPDGEVTELSDDIEPEDVSFHRDLGEFLDEIRKAYRKGYEEGRDN